VLDYVCPEYKDEPQSPTMSETGTAFVYCDWDQRDQQTPFNLIKSITRQLVDRRLTSADSAESRLEVANFLEKHKPTPSLKDYLTFLSSVVGKFKRVFIIVDGLDELYDSHREGFVKVILEISNIQLFVTSRDHISPTKEFTTLEIRSNPKDIEAYIEFRIDESPLALKDSIRKRPQLKAKILETVNHKYSNMYVSSCGF
jgi:hypothetical protein